MVQSETDRDQSRRRRTYLPLCTFSSGSSAKSDDASMAIVIVRAGDLYEATVSPPHGRGIAWKSPRPMTADLLVKALRERGCHQTDIGDAFYDADPEWLLR